MEDFMASDGWYIEGDKAWFIGTEYNAIFRADLVSLKCELISHFPVENIWEPRMNPRCVKVGDYIVSLPSYQSSIFFYNIKNNSFQQIEVDIPKKTPLSIYHYWHDSERVYCFSRSLQSILTIDVKNKKVVISKRIDEQINAMYAVKVGRCIWMPNSLDNRIFSYNLDNGRVDEYVLSNVKGKLYAICYDGENFWLTGNRREIYLWKKGDASVFVIDDFPEKFAEYVTDGKGVYSTNSMNMEFKEPPFNQCLFLNGSIWCIPFQTNMILKIEKDTYTISGIGDDETAREVLSREYNQKYLLEYVREGRYIGLFSLRKNSILELDTQNNRIEKREYHLINKEMLDKDFPVVYESGINKFFYQTILKRKESHTNKEMLRTGRKLYNKIVKQHK